MSTPDRAAPGATTMNHLLCAGGLEIARMATIPWEDRVNVDNWPSRAGLFYDDRENELCIRLIDYPVGSTEPRHVHAGTHATTVLRGTVQVDGLTLGPLDVIVGPGNEPHGPLHYPHGCKLLSAFKGSYFHSETAAPSGERRYRLVEQSRLPWQRGANCDVKTLVDRDCAGIVVEALRLAPGARLKGARRSTPWAALVVDGAADIDGLVLGEWDFMRAPAGVEHAEIAFPRGATLLTVTLAA